MEKIEETEFYKSLPASRQAIVLEAWERWNRFPPKPSINLFIQVYQGNFEREDQRRKAEWEKWNRTEIITYNVLDHPNDDPQGYVNALKRGVTDAGL